jgi:hypothetical protein
MTFVLSAVCLGANAWETTTFTGWSNETLQELLADSPWAGYATVSRQRNASTDAAAANEKALVTWTTALPMRQARVREAIGLNGTVSKDAEAFLSLTPSTYVLALQISGAPTSVSYAAQAQDVQKETFITRTDGRAPLEALSVEAGALDKDGRVLTGTAAASPVEGGSTVFVFQFSKGLALTMLDREVEFVTKVGGFNIKKKFKMKDMVYKGELAL